ncbi:MAG: PKD domain-containing protein [Bacteroidota bacterium]
MGTQLKSVLKNLAVAIAFCSMFFTAEKSNAQCVAGLTYTNPQSGMYVFTGTITPSIGNIWYWFDFGDGNQIYGQSATVTHVYSFPGTYYACVTVTDSGNGGCTNTSCQWITVASTICDITPQFTYMNMGGGNVMFTDATVDNGGGTITGWSWSFGDGGTSNLQNPSHTYASYNTYGVMLTVYNSNGCTDTIYNNVIVQNSGGCNLYASSTSTPTSCALCNGTLTATTTGGTAPFTYLWGNGATTQTITGLCSGYYDLTVSDAMGCSFDNVGTVFNSAISATITVDTSASNGLVVLYGSVTGGTGPYTYSWYIPGGNPSYSSTPITTVQYPYPSNNMTVCLTVYDANNCYDSTCYYFSIGGNGFNCSGFSAATTGTQTSANTWNLYATAVGGTAPYSYSWNLGGGISTCGLNQSIACGTYPNAGTYVNCCTITDANGCTSTSCYTVVVQPTACNANFYAYSTGDSTYFGNWSTGAANSTYTWDFGDGTSVTLPNIGAIAHHYTVGGINYNVCLSMDDGAGCTDTFCQSVATCNLSIGFNYTISGDTLNLFSNIIGNYNWVEWITSGGGVIATTPNATIVLPQGGNISVYLYVSDSATGCFDSLTQVINVNVPVNNVILGNVWNDLNGNGVEDAGEPGMPYEIVYIGGIPVNCDSLGNYSINIADGSWIFHLIPPYQWAQTFPLSPVDYTITVSGGDTITGVDFGVQSTVTTINGIVFNDLNNNGVQDAGEYGISNQWVQVGVYWASTNANGVYTVTVPFGSFLVQLYSIPAGATLSVPVSGNYTVVTSVSGQIYGGNNFGIHYPPGVQDLVIYISPYTTVTPCFPAWYDISYTNAGTVPVNGTVTMNYDAQLTFTTASPTPTSVDATNHILTWNVGTINPGGYGWIWVNFNASCSVVVGSDAFNVVTIQPIAGDAVPSNNIDTTHQTATASWDPNAKEVSPPGVGAQGFIHATQQLDYTIHYQNTGTAPAVNVVVVDTLSSQLDWSSIEILSNSHPMISSLDTTTGIIRFFFNNIMLPDSGADYAGSMGNVKFSAMPKNNIADGAVINNFGDIYFDFNVPVRTNTTVNTIDKNLSVTEVFGGENVQIYPNPTDEDITVELSQPCENCRMEIVNTLGQILIKDELNTNVKSYNLKAFAKGIYFINIISNNETVTVQKLIVQ